MQMDSLIPVMPWKSAKCRKQTNLAKKQALFTPNPRQMRNLTENRGRVPENSAESSHGTCAEADEIFRLIPDLNQSESSSTPSN
jgi:hypothetical protein